MNKTVTNRFSHKKCTVMLSAVLPSTGIRRIDEVYSKAMYKGISEYCRKSVKNGLSGDVTVKCETKDAGDFKIITTEISAFGKTVRLFDVYEKGIPWKPRKKEMAKIKNAVYRSTDRKVRLGVKLYPSAPELSLKYFGKADIIPDGYGFSVMYKKGMLADFETVIYVEKTK